MKNYPVYVKTKKELAKRLGISEGTLTNLMITKSCPTFGHKGFRVEPWLNFMASIAMEEKIEKLKAEKKNEPLHVKDFSHYRPLKMSKHAIKLWLALREDHQHGNLTEDSKELFLNLTRKLAWESSLMGYKRN